MEQKKVTYTGVDTEDVTEQLEPVSYTHLDVYKRQVPGKGPGQISLAGCHLACFLVSYLILF